jgi:hypothetical protein
LFSVVDRSSYLIYDIEYVIWSVLTDLMTFPIHRCGQLMSNSIDMNVCSSTEIHNEDPIWPRQINEYRIANIDRSFVPSDAQGHDISILDQHLFLVSSAPLFVVYQSWYQIRDVRPNNETMVYIVNKSSQWEIWGIISNDEEVRLGLWSESIMRLWQRRLKD